MRTLNITKPSQQALEQAFLVVAAARFLNANKKLSDISNIEKEASRIERCVDYYYKIDKAVKFDYPTFVSNFLKENYKEIVFGTKYHGLFLDELPDGKERETYIEKSSILMG